MIEANAPLWGREAYPRLSNALAADKLKHDVPIASAAFTGAGGSFAEVMRQNTAINAFIAARNSMSGSTGAAAIDTFAQTRADIQARNTYGSIAQQAMAWVPILNLVLTVVFFAMTSEEHTSEIQSIMRISYAVLSLKKTVHTEIKRYWYPRSLAVVLPIWPGGRIEEVMRQNTTSKAFIAARNSMYGSTGAAEIDTFTQTRAEIQARNTYGSIAQQAMAWVPILNIVLTVVFFAMFPVIFPLFLMPQTGVAALKGYVTGFFYLAAWGPLYVILHMICMTRATSAANGVAGGGVPLDRTSVGWGK